MSNSNKDPIPRQPSYSSLYHNPLTELKSEANNGVLTLHNGQNKENSEPNKVKTNSDPVVDKENVDSNITIGCKPTPIAKSRLKDRAWKPSSLQLCMQLNDPIPNFGSSFYEPIDSGKNNSGNIWDYSDSEAAPASSWSTLPNRFLFKFN